jgi:hypothetical protein
MTFSLAQAKQDSKTKGGMLKKRKKQDKNDLLTVI